jgi:hypothetical protein
MADGFTGPPAVDFYSMLSGLGDTIKAQQVTNARKEAFSTFTALDPNSPDYGKQAIGVAQRLGAAGDQDGALKFLTLAQTAADRAHTYQREGVTDQHWNQSFELQKRAADRADDPTPTGFVRNGDKAVPLVGGPADPAYLGAVAKARAEAEAQVGGGKPIEFQTLGGSKFLVKQPGGGYTVVDPNAIAQPGAPVPSTSRVVGDAEGVASGLYDPPRAPGQRPPVQVADAQPANFAARFQGQPAQSQAPQPPQPVDITAVDPQTGRRENWLKSQPADVQAYIKKIADYEIDPRTTSIKGGHREQVLSAVAQYDPTYDQNSFGSRAKAIRDFATGPQGNIVRSFDVAIDHLDTLQRAADALKNGNYRILNDLRNKWREQTGSELPTDFKALVPIVSGEIAKAVVGSQNALADREELRAGLKTSASPEQLSGVITGYKALMAGQLKGLRKQYEETTGKKNFDSRVRESTRKAILSDEPGSASKQPVVINGYTIKEN